jgi:hypothetical protein
MLHTNITFLFMLLTSSYGMRLITSLKYIYIYIDIYVTRTPPHRVTDLYMYYKF